MLALKPASIWSFIFRFHPLISEPETMSNNTFLAPVILLSFSNGESRAETIASLALFSPEETEIP
jgi:hypothetical protein